MGLLYNISVFLESFSFKQEERFDCGTKAGDVFASQRRFPQQMFWDFKVVFKFLLLGGGVPECLPPTSLLCHRPLGLFPTVEFDR